MLKNEVTVSHMNTVYYTKLNTKGLMVTITLLLISYNIDSYDWNVFWL